MPIKHYDKLAYENIDQFIFGISKNPVKLKSGMIIGGGKVYPELNFTLPTMMINEDTLTEVINQYKSIIEDACKRGVDLEMEGFVTEIELLPPTTYNPSWGEEITKVVKDILVEYENKYQLKHSIRITPVDIREDKKSPHMFRGSHFDLVMETFYKCAKAGAELLSIESIGGKDLHDDAILYCELDKSIFSLGVLGTMDMGHLWSSIGKIANETNTLSAGDTACGFANTAMVLADRKMVPKVFASVVRVISAVRSLVAVEEGAVGPDKDCGYEGIYLKAITGIPISMEGKSSACAHLSPVGNIASCAADLWSNESVQNVKLLGGMAPTISLEQLEYDSRLMNVALSDGLTKANYLKDWLIRSDSYLDPQAYVLNPEVVFRISKKIIDAKDDYLLRTKAAALATIEELRKGINEKKVKVEDKELDWLDRMEDQVLSIEDDSEAFTARIIDENMNEKFIPSKYDL